MKTRGISVSLIIILICATIFFGGCKSDGGSNSSSGKKISAQSLANVTATVAVVATTGAAVIAGVVNYFFNDNLSSEKAITLYSLNGVAGTIDETAKTIAVIVPFGTDLTNLVATFTTTGSKVQIGSTLQESGTTVNNFTSPVIYTVTATDGTTANYTITVIPTVISIDALPSSISRMAVSGTSVYIYVLIKPNNFTFTGSLNVTASDTTGIFLLPVSVTSNTDGTYTLTLTTSSSTASGSYIGNVTLNLYSDASCTVPQQIPSIALPFNINLLSSSSTWPGNNLTALSAWSEAQDWSMFQGNVAHTGFVPVTVDPNQFSTRWEIPAITATGSRYDLRGTLTTENGQFFNAGSNILYTRDEFDGSLVWSYDFSSLQYPSVNPPAVKDGVVYITAGHQSLTYFFAFNSSDGTLIFKSPMSSQWEYYLAPAIGASGVYTNAGTYGGLYGFNFSGGQLFFANMAQTSMWSPAVDATGVYTYTGGILRVVDPATGTVLHSITDPTFTNYIYEIGGSPVLGTAGSVFVANYENSLLNSGAIGNTLLNFNISGNSIAWSVAGCYPSTPAYANGVLYIANENPLRLEARAESDGTLLWYWTPPQAGDTRFKSEVLLTNNLVFVSTNLSTYAIDINTHRVVWSYPLMGRLALSKNGILYIQGSSWLVAINLK